ncbi:ATP-binding cassette domain-containing protein [Flavobacterium sp. CYK-4]|uniref:ABC transporter ATP-binding protein n=1 Tax=Flavobacterium lotistagni TaxID=2709660 RepID=UPI00140DF81D|nr:ATP-binding cassette domain-containing protein [Flavobacterium lotistagni]NHM06362.1 ATP-binding cassette domain-containing protein [Flavobacterium lotistagni]
MLSVNNISFSYANKPTLESVSFTLERGKCLAVIGESGCGKSTLLQLIYGLHDLNQGEIFWNGDQVFGPKFNLIPGVDTMKYLAQDFDLMPYITVAENIGKFLSNRYPKQKKERIAELLELVEMTEFAQTKVQFLSGGQMQRVALARVLALEPELILLDEPFSHIDNFRKNALRRKVFRHLKDKGITCIIASHDSKDILGYSDETLVIREGKMLSHADSKSVYENNFNPYIASLFDDISELPLGENGNMICAYPHQLKVVEKSPVKVQTQANYFKGNGYLIEADFEGSTVFFENKTPIEKGTFLYLKFEK